MGGVQTPKNYSNHAMTGKQVASLRIPSRRGVAHIDDEQHLENLRRKDSLRGADTTEISVRLGHYSASHFEGSANRFSDSARRIGVSVQPVETVLDSALS